MTANKGPVDRDAQCPARGPLLGHAPEVGRPGVCAHCGVAIAIRWSPTGPTYPPVTPPIEPFNVIERLKALGYMPTASVTDVTNDDEVLIEPKMRGTPLEPLTEWPAWKRYRMPRGRTLNGELSEADKRSLYFHVFVVRQGHD